MKTFIGKLREMPIDKLLIMIERQESEIRIADRDLLTMRQVLSKNITSKSSGRKMPRR